jgi:hypothetical protein
MRGRSSPDCREHPQPRMCGDIPADNRSPVLRVSAETWRAFTAAVHANTERCPSSSRVRAAKASWVNAVDLI